MVKTGTFVEYELAEDVKQLIAENKSIQFSDPKVKEKIQNFDDLVVLKVTKQIDSPIKIMAVEAVDEDFISKNF